MQRPMKPVNNPVALVFNSITHRLLWAEQESHDIPTILFSPFIRSTFISFLAKNVLPLIAAREYVEHTAGTICFSFWNNTNNVYE